MFQGAVQQYRSSVACQRKAHLQFVNDHIAGTRCLPAQIFVSKEGGQSGPRLTVYHT